MEAGNSLFRRRIINAFLGVLLLVIACCCGFAESLTVVPLYNIPGSVISSVESVDKIRVFPVEASPRLLIVHNVEGEVWDQSELLLVDLQKFGVRSIELPSELLLLSDLAVSENFRMCVSGIYSLGNDTTSRFSLQKIWCKQSGDSDWFVLKSSSDPTIPAGTFHFVSGDTVIFLYYGSSAGKDLDSICSGSLSQRQVQKCSQLPPGVESAWKMVDAGSSSVIVANYFGSLYNYQWVCNDVIGVVRRQAYVFWFLIEDEVHSRIALSSTGEALSWRDGAWSSIAMNVPKALLPVQVLAQLAPGKALISDSKRERCSVVSASASAEAASFPCGEISNSLIVRTALGLVVIQLDGRGGVNIGKLKVGVTP